MAGTSESSSKRARLRRRLKRLRLGDLSPRCQAIIADARQRRGQQQTDPLRGLLAVWWPSEEIALANDLARLGERADFMASDVESAIAGRKVTPLVIALLLAKHREEFEKRVWAERLKRARDSASRPRKAPEWDAKRLLAFKADYVKKRGMEYGWIGSAAGKAGVDRKTIRLRIKEKIGT